MKRQGIGLAILALVVGLIGFLSVRAQRQAPGGKTQETSVAGEPPQVAAANYTLSGPYTHHNLAVFLIHSQDTAKGDPPLTLQEAMTQKKVIVHETGDVNELAIENVSPEEVFVQSGDIVKGGQQDRVLALDLIVPPKSGKVPISAFCVEHGRWSKRGNEAVAAFSASEKMLNSKELKIAAKHKGSQQEVWDNVAVSQRKLSAGVMADADLATPRPAPAIVANNGDAAARTGAANLGGGNLGAGGGGGSRPADAMSVVSAQSASSLQLTLENNHVQRSAGDYVKKLSSIIEGKRDVIGYAFAINGQINSADVYSSNGLFKKLWPKLLEASAIEAVGEFEKGKTYKPVTVDQAKAFLNEAETGKAETKDLAGRGMMIKRETEKNLFFETRDRKQSGAWVHRNYITK